MLAIDISRTSLAYARRKTRALGLTNIEYGQADILKLASLGRHFDVIETVGVLHHLADPAAGWRLLLSLLRPNGLMLVGLYSATARQSLAAARAFIAERGYTPTAEDIRACRQELMQRHGMPPFRDFSSHQRLPRSVVQRHGARVHDSADRGVSRREPPDISRLRADCRPMCCGNFGSSFRIPRRGAISNAWHAFEQKNP